MFSALMKSFAQASDPAFRQVFLRSLWLSLGAFAALWALAWFGLAWLGEDLAVWIAEAYPDSAWVAVFEWAYGAAAVAGVFIASVFLFPAVMAGVTVACLAFLLSGWRMGRIEGSVFLIAYAAYIAMLFNRGQGVL